MRSRMYNDISAFEAEVEACVRKVLEGWGKKAPRYSGTVSAIDAAGTTAFIVSGNNTPLLAFVGDLKLQVGTTVEFVVDQLRATRLKVISQPEVIPALPEFTESLDDLPPEAWSFEVDPEIEMVPFGTNRRRF